MASGSRTKLKTTTSKTVTKTPTGKITRTVKRTTRVPDYDELVASLNPEQTGGLVRAPSPETLRMYREGFEHNPPVTISVGGKAITAGLVSKGRPTKTSRARASLVQQAKIKEIMAPKTSMKTTTSKSSVTRIEPSGSKSTITKTTKRTERPAPQQPQRAVTQQQQRQPQRAVTQQQQRQPQRAVTQQQQRQPQRTTKQQPAPCRAVQEQPAARQLSAKERERGMQRYQEIQRALEEQRRQREAGQVEEVEEEEVIEETVDPGMRSFERAEEECVCPSEAAGGVFSPRAGPSSRRSPTYGVDLDSSRRASPPTALRSPESKHPVSPLESSMLHAEVASGLLNKSLGEQAMKVKETGTRVTEVAVPMVETPEGFQPALQHLTIQKKIERSPEGERITKYLSGIDTDEYGKARQIELETESVDPKERLHTGALKEIVSITSSLAVTASHTQATKHILREIQSIDTGINMTPEQLVTLVEEENEDVETTMKIIPPDLIEASPEKYGLKKRLQKLRLNSESVALLEQSVVYPTPTADEEQAETPPEAVATIMHSIEKGVTPKSPPNQLFKALFSENKEPEVMTVCSVAPGPLSDVVVPTDVPSEMFKEAMDTQMEKTIEIVQVTEEKPKTSIFVDTKPAEPKSATKPKKKREPRPISAEKPPWTDEDLEPMLEVTGAVKQSRLEGVDFNQMPADEAEEQLLQGIEYYLDAEPMQYVSRVQLRGSQMPAWFPGYMVALPDIGEVVRLSRSPSEVLVAAWKAVQPKVFPEDSMVCVDF